MALTVETLINDDRFCGENVLQFMLYLPFGIILLVVRTFLALILWVASIILPNKSAVRQMLSTLACWTFGVYVKLKGTRDPRCSVLVANYVSCLDSLAASHVLGTISLRKWKVPPFFASTLGIRNASQFVRKQHFADCTNKPVLLQPEGGPTNGKGLLKFTDWPFQIGNRVQPVAITVERPFTKVTVHGAQDARDKFPWSDALWFLWTPLTVFTVASLPPLERGDASDEQFAQRARAAVADALGVEMSEFRWEELNAGGSGGAGGAAGVTRGGPPPELTRLARQVREVLPRVPLRDILRDLAVTRSVDLTITNFLEGAAPYTPELAPAAAPLAPLAPAAPPAPATPPRYVTPAPTGVFPKSAKERQLSFQERKAHMVAAARRAYLRKHGLAAPLAR